MVARIERREAVRIEGRQVAARIEFPEVPRIEFQEEARTGKRQAAVGIGK